MLAEINQVKGVPKVPVAERKGGQAVRTERGWPWVAGAESAPAACSDRRLVMWARARPSACLADTELSLQRAWLEAVVCVLPPNVLPFSN